MRFAAFNVENLFDRAKVFNDTPPGAPNPHQDIIDGEAELNILFEKPVYTAADKARMLVLFHTLGLLNANESEFAWLRRIRGKIIHRFQDGRREIVADGRDDWIGWVELKTEAVDEVAVELTARVIFDANADVLAVIEAENRVVLKRFQTFMAEKFGVPERYPHLMLIDGNDDRGIDVGLATGPDIPIGKMLSHVDEVRGGRTVFSRDCPEFEIRTPSGNDVLIMVNHFKSKFGNQSQSNARRKKQAEVVAEYYEARIAEGVENIIVMGDLNDRPGSAPLKPLLDTSLRDVSEHPAFTDFEFLANNGNRGIGTYDLGNDADKIDFLLVSPNLFGKITNGGLWRMGAWPGSQPVRWQTYPELTRREHAASDHHLIFADIDI
jgi:endonuclease/exonuclease/phosphatase family metal-dependent hydrolase